VKPPSVIVHSFISFRSFTLDQRFVTGATIRKTYDVSSSTLRDWADQGKVEAIRTQAGAGKRRYRLADVATLLGVEPSREEETRRRICYARVSSAHQQADLERQCADLQRERPGHEFIYDVGSGINWKRAGLLAILDAVCAGTVAEIVVAHRDRLARIGVELLEWLFCRYDTKLVVLDHAEHESETEELRDDLLAVVTFFVARNNGRRAAANRKRRRDAAASQEGQDNKEERQAKRRKGEKDSRVPESTAASVATTVVRDGALGL